MYFINIEAPILGEKTNIESITKSVYLGTFQIKDRYGKWINAPIDVYYSPDPDRSKGHKHYFGFYSAGGKTYVCDCTSAVESDLTCLYSPETKEVVFSRYNHDYVKLGDSYIDGGRECVRMSFGESNVEVGRLYVKEDKYILITDEGEEYVVEQRHLPRKLTEKDQ